MSKRTQKPERHGKLSIPLPFEDAVKAAVETGAPESTKRPARKRRRKKRAQ